MTEKALQTLCFQFAWNDHPRTRMCLLHVPNGGTRHKIEAMQLKASGVIKGVHDLLFYWKSQLYWFEVKVGTNKQSPAQIAFGAAMLAQGAILIEIRDFETFENKFLSIIKNSTC